MWGSGTSSSIGSGSLVENPRNAVSFAMLTTPSDCDGTGHLQQTFNETPTKATGISCVYGESASWARCYVLAVTGARIGIGGGNPHPNFVNFTLTVNVYRSKGCLLPTPDPNVGNTLLVTATLLITPDKEYTTEDVFLDTMGAVLGVDEALLIEVVKPSKADGISYFPGATPNRTTGISYYKATCDRTNYVDLCAYCGFCNNHNIMSLDTIDGPSSTSCDFSNLRVYPDSAVKGRVDRDLGNGAALRDACGMTVSKFNTTARFITILDSESSVRNTTNPRFDPDLGSPHRSCGGGVGRGFGGKQGELWENCEPLGKVLVLQDLRYLYPNDCRHWWLHEVHIQ
jgi:hypothetical protein